MCFFAVLSYIYPFCGFTREKQSKTPCHPCVDPKHRDRPSTSQKKRSNNVPTIHDHPRAQNSCCCANSPRKWASGTDEKLACGTEPRPSLTIEPDATVSPTVAVPLDHRLEPVPPPLDRPEHINQSSNDESPGLAIATQPRGQDKSFALHPPCSIVKPEAAFENPTRFNSA